MMATKWLNIRIDYLALLVAALALILSFYSFWWHELRDENHLQARVVRLALRSADGRPALRDTVVVSVAFFNTGNRQAIVLPPQFRILSSKSHRWQSFLITESVLPLVLEPREARVVDLLVGVPTLFYEPGLGIGVEKSISLDGQWLGTIPRDFSIAYSGLDSRGRLAERIESSAIFSTRFLVPLGDQDEPLLSLDSLPRDPVPAEYNVWVKLFDSTEVYSYREERIF